MSSAAEQRQAVADLNAIARRDLDEFWRLLEGLDAEQVRDALMDVLPGLGSAYGDAATSLAADWYESVREMSQARGVFSPVLASPPDTARWDALARWGVTPLFDEQPDADTALAKVAGGLQRSIADQHRMTVVESSIADPAASGWRRVGVGAACDFCRMLIGRGAVYTEATSTFLSHDNCNCAAAPAFKGTNIPLNAGRVPSQDTGADPNAIVSVGDDTPVPASVANTLDKWVQLRGSGTISLEERAALAEAIEKMGAPAPKVYRGAGVKRVPRVGEKIEFGPSSSSVDIWSAEPYAASSDGVPVVFEFPRGVKGLRVSDRAEAIAGYAEEEWIVSGKFQVARTRMEDDVRVVVLETLKKKPTAAPRSASRGGLSIKDLERRIASETRRARSSKSSASAKKAARNNLARYRRELNILKRKKR